MRKPHFGSQHSLRNKSGQFILHYPSHIAFRKINYSFKTRKQDLTNTSGDPSYFQYSVSIDFYN